MWVERFEIPDEELDLLLASIGADRASLGAGEQAQARLVALLRYVLAGMPDVIEAKEPMARERVEEELLRLAGAPTAADAVVDMRGVPFKVRFAGESAFRPIDRAPAAYLRLEEQLDAVYRTLAAHPELRRLVSGRLLPTSERYLELLAAEPDASISVDLPFAVGGTTGRYRFTLAPETTLLVGALAESPQPIRERR